MRIACSVFATLLMVSVVPSVGLAQVVIPYPETANHGATLEGIVPVATVTVPAEAIALDRPQQGHDLVLGAASLDLKDRAHPMIVFTISNATHTAIPLSKVGFRSVGVNSRVANGLADGRLNFSCAVWSQLGEAGPADRALEPGAAVTVSLPAPLCPVLGENVGFLVFLESVIPQPPNYKTNKIDVLLQNAFQMLRESLEEPNVMRR